MNRKRIKAQIFNALTRPVAPIHPSGQGSWWYFKRALRHRLRLPVRIHGILVNVHRVGSPLIVSRLLANWYEQSEVQALRGAIEPADRVLELGAGLGMTGCLAAQSAKKGQVLSFEANPELVSLAREHAEMNGCRNFEVRHGILAASSGEHDFFVSPRFWVSRLQPTPGWKKIKVKAFSVREIVESFRPSVVIIDIEGGEYDLLQFEADWSTDELRKLFVEFHQTEVAKDWLQDSWLFRSEAWMSSISLQNVLEAIDSSHVTVTFQRKSTGRI